MSAHTILKREGSPRWLRFRAALADLDAYAYTPTLTQQSFRTWLSLTITFLGWGVWITLVVLTSYLWAYTDYQVSEGQTSHGFEFHLLPKSAHQKAEATTLPLPSIAWGFQPGSPLKDPSLVRYSATQRVVCGPGSTVGVGSGASEELLLLPNTPVYNERGGMYEPSMTVLDVEGSYRAAQASGRITSNPCGSSLTLQDGTYASPRIVGIYGQQEFSYIQLDTYVDLGRIANDEETYNSIFQGEVRLGISAPSTSANSLADGSFPDQQPLLFTRRANLLTPPSSMKWEVTLTMRRLDASSFWWDVDVLDNQALDFQPRQFEVLSSFNPMPPKDNITNGTWWRVSRVYLKLDERDIMVSLSPEESFLSLLSDWGGYISLIMFACYPALMFNKWIFDATVQKLVASGRIKMDEAARRMMCAGRAREAAAQWTAGGLHRGAALDKMRRLVKHLEQLDSGSGDEGMQDADAPLVQHNGAIGKAEQLPEVAGGFGVAHRKANPDPGPEERPSPDPPASAPAAPVVRRCRNPMWSFQEEEGEEPLEGGGSDPQCASVAARSGVGVDGGGGVSPVAACTEHVRGAATAPGVPAGPVCEGALDGWVRGEAGGPASDPAAAALVPQQPVATAGLGGVAAAAAAALDVLHLSQPPGMQQQPAAPPPPAASSGAGLMPLQIGMSPALVHSSSDNVGGRSRLGPHHPRQAPPPSLQPGATDAVPERMLSAGSGGRPATAMRSAVARAARAMHIGGLDQPGAAAATAGPGAATAATAATAASALFQGAPSKAGQSSVSGASIVSTTAAVSGQDSSRRRANGCASAAAAAGAALQAEAAPPHNDSARQASSKSAWSFASAAMGAVAALSHSQAASPSAPTSPARRPSSPAPSAMAVRLAKLAALQQLRELQQQLEGNASPGAGAGAAGIAAAAAAAAGSSKVSNGMSALSDPPGSSSKQPAAAPGKTTATAAAAPAVLAAWHQDTGSSRSRQAAAANANEGAATRPQPESWPSPSTAPAAGQAGSKAMPCRKNGRAKLQLIITAVRSSSTRHGSGGETGAVPGAYPEKSDPHPLQHRPPSLDSRPSAAGALREEDVGGGGSGGGDASRAAEGGSRGRRCGADGGGGGGCGGHCHSDEGTRREGGCADGRCSANGDGDGGGGYGYAEEEGDGAASSSDAELYATMRSLFVDCGIDVFDRPPYEEGPPCGFDDVARHCTTGCEAMMFLQQVATLVQECNPRLSSSVPQCRLLAAYHDDLPSVPACCGSSSTAAAARRCDIEAPPLACY